MWPEKLVSTMIKAGTSERGCCPACGSPWRRQVEKSRTFESGSGRSGNDPVGKNGAGLQGGGETGDVRRGPVVHAVTTGWRAGCECSDEIIPLEPVPAVVLDPFAGTATTGVSALKLGRHFVGIELSPAYVAIIERRLRQLDAWQPELL